MSVSSVQLLTSIFVLIWITKLNDREPWEVVDGGGGSERGGWYVEFFQNGLKV